MVFAVMYKVDSSKKDYSSLYERIKAFDSWMHYLDSGWLVCPPEKKTAKEIYDELVPLIDGDRDYLLVIEVKKHWSGWLPKDAREWLEKRSFE